MAQIASGKVNGHVNNDQANAIYFFSYGKFKTTCTGITAGYDDRSASPASVRVRPLTPRCSGTSRPALP